MGVVPRCETGRGDFHFTLKVGGQMRHVMLDDARLKYTQTYSIAIQTQYMYCTFGCWVHILYHPPLVPANTRFTPLLAALCAPYC